MIQRSSNLISKYLLKNKWTQMVSLLLIDTAVIRYLPAYIIGTLTVFLFRKMYECCSMLNKIQVM